MLTLDKTLLLMPTLTPAQKTVFATPARRSVSSRWVPCIAERVLARGMGAITLS